jgi:hypothetical protein
MLESRADGLWFSVDNRRYHILSPVRLDGQSQLVITLALYNGQGNVCLHQDEANISVAKGRTAYARGCHAMEAPIIASDLLKLDTELRQAIEREATRPLSPDAEPTPQARCGNVEEGAFSYYRLRTECDGTVVRTPLSSFIIAPEVRIWIDRTEAIRAVLKTASQSFPGITFERHHWHSRGVFLKALPSLDLWCVASDNEIQSIQAIVAGKQVPRKHGTRALGFRDGIWVGEAGALDAQGWMTDPPVLYLPHGGESTLTGCVRYRTADATSAHDVAKVFYE